MTTNEDKEIIEELIKKLEADSFSGQDLNKTKRTIITLGRFGDRAAIPVLSKLLEDKSPEIRKHATLALGEIGDEKTILLLQRMMNDEDGVVRACALFSLGEIGVNDAFHRAIDKSLKDADPIVSTCAFWFRLRRTSIVICDNTSWPYGSPEDLFKKVDNYLGVYRSGKESYQRIFKKITSDALEVKMEHDLWKAQDYEKVYRLEDAAKIYEEWNMIEDARRVRKMALNSTSVQQQIVAQSVDMSTKTEIKDSVVQRSNIGSSSETPFSICPYCGKKLNLPKTPNFCPYCEESLK